MSNQNLQTGGQGAQAESGSALRAGAARQEDGGPAFPQGWDPVAFQPFCGMTLRDYFAAKAMLGDFASQQTTEDYGSQHFDALAVRAYKMADAMLKARSLAQ